jgi:hypothetical protein
MFCSDLLLCCVYTEHHKQAARDDKHRKQTMRQKYQSVSDDDMSSVDIEPDEQNNQSPIAEHDDSVEQSPTVESTPVRDELSTDVYTAEQSEAQD